MSVDELRHACEALEHELTISQQVKASTLEEIDLNTIEDPWPLKITKELAPVECSTLVTLLKYYNEFIFCQMGRTPSIGTAIIYYHSFVSIKGAMPFFTSLYDSRHTSFTGAQFASW